MGGCYAGIGMIPLWGKGGTNRMTSQETIQNFYHSLTNQQEREVFWADELVFSANGKQRQGKAASIEGLQRFYSSVQTFEIQQLLVDGANASAVVRYVVQSPKGHTFVSDVAEFFNVEDGKIVAFAIYFDTVPYL
jgi:ketosteroid isomerase-like protein